MTVKEIFKEIIIKFHYSNIKSHIIERDINIPINIDKIISIIGIRRSGKTYTLFYQIKELIKNIDKKNIIYINFEDERLDIKKEQLNYLLEAYLELYPDIEFKNIYFFFDEIQNVEGWEKFVRRIYDEYSKNIFITGSNSKLLSTDIATSLRGRTITREIYPLSFKEFLKFKKLEFSNHDFYNPKKAAIIKNYFKEYLLFGGFPEIVNIQNNELKTEILQNYFNVMLYRDLIERYKISNVVALKYFFKRIIESTGKITSINKIYNELKSMGIRTGKDVLYEYLDYGETIYLFQVLKKYDKSVIKMETSSKKIYFIDSGLINANSFSFKENLGNLLECIVYRELKRRFDEIFFFYNNQSECDFICFKNKEIIPFQVCYNLNEDNLKRELKGIKEACKYFSLKKGIILTNNEEKEIEFNNLKILVIPVWKYFLS